MVTLAELYNFLEKKQNNEHIDSVSYPKKVDLFNK